MSQCCAPKDSVRTEAQPELTASTEAEINLDGLVTDTVRLWPALGLVEQRLSLKLYRLLAQGVPVSRAMLAQQTGIAIATVSQILDSWPSVFSDPQGNIVGYCGLAVPDAYKSPHRFTIGDRTLSAWCAWDTLFLIPAPVTRSVRRCGIHQPGLWRDCAADSVAGARGAG